MRNSIVTGATLLLVLCCLALIPARAQQPESVQKLNFRINVYKPALLDKYSYRVRWFSDSAGGSTAVIPDAQGRVEVSLPTVSRNSVPLYALLFSIRKDTGDVAFTMDLDNVPLPALVTALATAMRSGRLQNAGLDIFPEVEPVTIKDPSAQAIRLALKGENLSLEEVLKQIYRTTNCEIVRAPYQLVITACI